MMTFVVILLYIACFAPAILSIVKALRDSNAKTTTPGSHEKRIVRRFVMGLAAAGVLTIFLISLGAYLNYLWFDNLGYAEVYSKKLWTQLWAFAIFGAAGAALAYTLTRFAFSMLPKLERPAQPAQDLQQDSKHRYERRFDIQYALRNLLWFKVLRGILIGVAALVIGAIGASEWENLLKFTEGVQVGEVDPVFGKDIGFYLFQLPLLSDMSSLLFWCTVLLTIVGFLIATGLRINVVDKAAPSFQVARSEYHKDPHEGHAYPLSRIRKQHLARCVVVCSGQMRG